MVTFFQVLNGLGKVNEKDIWVQEPESKVSLVALGTLSP